MLNQLSSRLMFNIIKIFQRFIEALQKKKQENYTRRIENFMEIVKKGNVFLLFIYLAILLLLLLLC